MRFPKNRFSSISLWWLSRSEQSVDQSLREEERSDQEDLVQVDLKELQSLNMRHFSQNSLCLVRSSSCRQSEGELQKLHCREQPTKNRVTHKDSLSESKEKKLETSGRSGSVLSIQVVGSKAWEHQSGKNSSSSSSNEDSKDWREKISSDDGSNSGTKEKDGGPSEDLDDRRRCEGDRSLGLLESTDQLLTLWLELGLELLELSRSLLLESDSTLTDSWKMGKR
ncbi:hypothetical protein GCK72_010962 [Caenorhabditis remanei]|uniref:Uncharacterized protein n=1 Tax=Caenorhabditis remanei TaxID=31234 RepID=A0A6A5H4B4_CAERE|nr:hypothetical protein GCK72_010962 [Caenorhabditis remanei]KAF1762700.1 hypothetical protein GCK72_010962 [Caenorhabditis remanei]